MDMSIKKIYNLAQRFEKKAVWIEGDKNPLITNASNHQTEYNLIIKVNKLINTQKDLGNKLNEVKKELEEAWHVFLEFKFKTKNQT